MQSEAMDNLKAHMTLLFDEIKKELQGIKNDIQELRESQSKPAARKRKAVASKK